MKVVFSGPITDYVLLKKKEVKNVLFTFAVDKVERAIDKHWVQNCTYHKDLCVHMDSGAFTVWNTGGTFTVDDHIRKVEEFYKKYHNTFKELYFISLDVIPGRPGVVPTQKEIDDSAKQTYENYLKSKRSGVIPEHLWLVTLHQHEDPQLILDYQKENDYVCISPANDQSNNGRSKWLDKVYALIDPKVKTHGLAVTGEIMLERYPWYSADSISWKLPRMFGQLFYKDFWAKKTAERISNKTLGSDLHKLNLKDFYFNNYTDKEKLQFQIQYFLDLENDITHLWEERGIKWNE